ncbi:MAG: hypothetical protein IJV94_04870 [Bacilli bacterium]|nr:hypothetical protein [Bacilli bacterium]
MTIKDETGAYDFYCNGYRYFHNLQETKIEWQQIRNNSQARQHYGEDVIEFNSITELNETIQKLTALRNAVNGNNFNNSHIQKDFGDNGIAYNTKVY